MTLAQSLWHHGVKTGVIGGITVLVIALVGMVESFNKRFIIADVMTMGIALVIVVAVLITVNIMNLLLHIRIRDHLPEIQKEEIKHYERLIAEKDKRMSWLESEIDVQRQAVRGAMGYLSGLVPRGKK